MTFFASLDRIEDERAILITSEHQIVAMPLSLLPTGATIGSSYRFLIGRPDEDSGAEAKNILNELLKAD